MKDLGIFESKSNTLDTFSWLFGIAVAAIGIVNIFWGNDAGFGVFIFLLAFVYLPSANASFKKLTRFYIPLVVKIILAIFIIWASFGVGELIEKIGLMTKDL